MDKVMEAKLSIESAKGNRANSAYSEFFYPFSEEIKSALMERFLRADPELLAEIQMTYKLVDKIDKYLHNFIDSGKLAELSLSSRGE